MVVPDPWGITRNLPVTFTAQLTRKRPIWKDGELRLASGTATLHNEHGRGVETITVTTGILQSIEDGSEITFESHRVVPNAVPESVAPAAALPAPEPARPFKRPRMLLPPLAVPQCIQRELESAHLREEPSVVAQAEVHAVRRGLPRDLHDTSSPVQVSHVAPMTHSAIAHKPSFDENSSRVAEADLWKACVAADKRKHCDESDSGVSGQKPRDLWAVCVAEVSQTRAKATKFVRRWQRARVDVPT